MGKKIDWFNGKNALNDYDMQEICDQIANADTPQNLAEVIKGSEQVIVDVAEDNKSLEIHLDAETTADIARSLKTPVSAPTETNLVAVDTTNSQEMLTLGTGLSIENGILSASGGKLYQHRIRLTYYQSSVLREAHFNIITRDNSLFDLNKLNAYLYGIGATTNTKALYVIPYLKENDLFFSNYIYTTSATSSPYVYYMHVTLVDGALSFSRSSTGFSNIYDTVNEI